MSYNFAAMRRAMLAVVFAALVVYGEEPKGKAKANEGVPAHAVQQTDSAPRGTIIVVNQPTPQPQENNHSTKSPSYLHELLLPQNVPSVALVIVGIFTFVAIWWQAKKTAEAAQAMRDSIPLQKSAADAALLNAKAVINAERPWVMIQIQEETVDQTDRAGIFSKRSFQFTIFNYGKTPAHIVDCKGPRIRFCEDPDKELPIPPDYGVSEWGKRFLAPRDSFPIGDRILPSDIRMGTAVSAAAEGQRVKGSPVAYGLIEYNDGVSDKAYRTAFCYRHERMPLSSMGGHFVLCGPRIYNEYT